MNRFTHFEFATRDFEKTAEFYRAVFGWQVEKWEARSTTGWYPAAMRAPPVSTVA